MDGWMDGRWLDGFLKYCDAADDDDDVSDVTDDYGDDVDYVVE